METENPKKGDGFKKDPASEPSPDSIRFFSDDILDQLPFGILLLMPKKQYSRWEWQCIKHNATANKIFGLTDETYSIKSSSQCLKFFSDRHLAEFAKVLKKDILYKDELSLYSGKRQLNIPFSCTKFHDGLMVTFDDASKKKILSKKPSNALESDIIPLSSLGTFEYDFKEEKLSCNDEFFKVFGINKSGNFSLNDVQQHIHPDDRIKVNKILEFMLMNRFPMECLFRILTSGNEVKPVFCKAQILSRPDGQPMKLLGTLTDSAFQVNCIEERDNRIPEKPTVPSDGPELIDEPLEHPLKQQSKDPAYISEGNNKVIQNLNLELDTFIRSASDNLSLPILNIESIVVTLAKEIQAENTEAHHLIDLLHLSLNKCKTTLEDLAELAQVQNEKAKKQNIDLKILFEDIKFLLHEEILKYGAIVEADFSQVSDLFFSKNNIRFILLGLISNALKYSSPLRRSEIMITTHYEGNYTVLSVKDNGLGIKEEDKDKIFYAFKRIYSHVSGSGLGLFVIKRIVENNEGKIEVDSNINVGSIFKIYFKKQY